MASINTFKDLIVWQEAHKLVVFIINETEKLPKKDNFVLVNQITRAAVSITSNIAEGFGRQSNKDTKHFYTIARGSLYEVQNQLEILKDTQKITEDTFNELAKQTTVTLKLLHGLIRKIDV